MKGRVERGLVVLAKWPRAGRAKRRLRAAVGTRGSTALAHAFLADTAALAGRTCADATLVAFAPPSAADRFAVVFPGAALVAQPRGSFGTRLARALDAGLERARAVVLTNASGGVNPTYRAGTLMVILVNLLVDLAYAKLDPRVAAG